MPKHDTISQELRAEIAGGRYEASVRLSSEAQLVERSRVYGFDELAPCFETLHEFGWERDKAGNRTLHDDQFCMGMLLGCFTPSSSARPSTREGKGDGGLFWRDESTSSCSR